MTKLYEQIQQIASSFSGLSLLLLVGSRARGDARSDSDWDFAFVGASSLHVDLLCGQLSAAVGTDAIDMIDLNHMQAH